MSGMLETACRPIAKRSAHDRTWDIELPRTKTGALKQKLTLDEKLRILDPYSTLETIKDRLLQFELLFAYRYTNGIITRVGAGPSSWIALKGPIYADNIARHLLANRLPTHPPQWVGARSFPTSLFACIDVDNHGPKDDIKSVRSHEKLQEHLRAAVSFPENCERVEQALRRLGIDPDNAQQVLVQATPSEGRHYYVFFDQPYGIDQYEVLWNQVGLSQKKGRIEFFPSMSHGLRLPFGHIPGHYHDPGAWIQFIDNYTNGTIKRFSLAELYDNYYRLSRSLEQKPNPELVSPKANPKPNKSAAVAVAKNYLGVPKAKGQSAGRQAASPQAPTHEATQRYQHLVNHGPKTFQEAEELMDLGIMMPGTRHTVLKDLAQHHVWHRGLSAEVATEQLTEWAYDPRHQSHDIQRDIRNGTNTQAAQIASLCRWYEARRDPNRSKAASTKPQFATAELQALRPHVLSLAPDERKDQAHFLLCFLDFAKLYGVATEDGDGWDAAPAVAKVIRRWPGCNHKHYKIRMRRAEAAGIFKMVKEKWQNPKGKGRARTYRLSVPVVPREGWSLDYDTALAFLTQEAATLPVPGNNTEAAGTKGPISPLDVAQHLVDGAQHQVDDVHPDLDLVDGALQARERNENDESTSPTGRADQPPDLHPQRAGAGLEQGPRKRDQEQDAVVGVPGQANGAVPAVPAATAGQAEPNQFRAASTKADAKPAARRRQRVRAPNVLTWELPAHDDHAAIAATIRWIKKQMLVAFPTRKREINRSQTWSFVEAMAKDPGYSLQHRYLLLNDPTKLNPEEVNRRKELLREFRQQKEKDAMRPAFPGG
jgi:hypothetical protein